MTLQQNTLDSLYAQAPESQTKFTPQELENLVHRAQQQDQEALTKLCQQFAPLVKATASSYSCYSSLGEDAHSLAWLILIQTILQYKHKTFATFPGYLRAALRTRLASEILKPGNIDNHLLFMEPDETWSTSSFDEQVFNNLILKQALAKLQEPDRRLLMEIYFDFIPFSILAMRYNCELSHIYMRHSRSLCRLRKRYLELIR